MTVSANPASRAGVVVGFCLPPWTRIYPESGHDLRTQWGERKQSFADTGIEIPATDMWVEEQFSFYPQTLACVATGRHVHNWNSLPALWRIELIQSVRCPSLLVCAGHDDGWNCCGQREEEDVWRASGDDILLGTAARGTLSADMFITPFHQKNTPA